MRGRGAGSALRLCRRNSRRDGVAITGLLGKFGFWRRVHLPISRHALPANRGGTYLRYAIRLAGEIPGGPLAPTDGRRKLRRRAIPERPGPDDRASVGIAHR